MYGLYFGTAVAVRAWRLREETHLVWAAGIAAYLLRLARVLREGRTTPALARLDTWWNVP